MLGPLASVIGSDRVATSVRMYLAFVKWTLLWNLGSFEQPDETPGRSDSVGLELPIRPGGRPVGHSPK